MPEQNREYLNQRGIYTNPNQVDLFHSTPETTISAASPNPYGTHTEYVDGPWDPTKVDWFHFTTNIAGAIGDGATALTAAGFLPTIPVAVIADTIESVGIAVDVMDAIEGIDFSGLSWDIVSKVGEESDFERIIPIIGFSWNIKGAYDAWHQGYEQIPIEVPNPPVIITAPPNN